ncbi:GH92 family glycosyl hydrolase [Allokutzneria sp. NRRL B-24872]|uniref:GH92 family glycosyl hydrolase n=1 Tax=Allokutzneria sp. NRRL B-24872 TaxID=1137961 RepID=UPI000A3C3F36|nr:GH92 family glycosyl hydrolase [Allokutzneria sp. NRRL B-24872]
MPLRGRRTLALLLAILLPQVAAASPAPEANPAEHVNPLIGTKGGETWPGAVTPLGMLQWSPENTRGNQNRTVRPGGYGYDHTKIRGFSLTHLSGTGCAGAFGDIPFFPHPGEVTSSPTADLTDSIYASTFSHANEIAKPGYYSVGLDSGARAELTATTRTGSGRFTYPQGKPATMLFRTSSSEVGSSDADLRIDPARRTVSGSVTGGNFCGYINEVGRRSYYTLHFTAEFDKPFTSTGTWQDDKITPGSTTSRGGTGWTTGSFPNAGWPVPGKGSGGYVTFDTGGQPVNARVGISFVSAEGARANLRAENPSGTSFDRVRASAYNAWKRQLSKVKVSGGTRDQLATFYTSIYHSLLHPNVFNDVDGSYVGMDQKVHRVGGPQRAQYANFSGWDVYRGQLQLLTLLEPEVGSDIAQSLYNQAEQNNGIWDRWTHGAGGTHVMTGDPGPVSVASIYAFGGTKFDTRGALKSMTTSARTVKPEDLSRDGWNVMVIGQRPSLDKYLNQHYVPADGNAWGGAGETLEDVAADFGIAQFARRLGDTRSHDEYLARSGYWRNVFNPATGYIQDRMSDGSWRAPFDPAGDEGFAEGSSAQYTWMIPFDVRGLATAMGGPEATIAKLDKFFRKPDGSWALTKAGGLHSEMDNEPSIGAPWVYNHVGAPAKAQETIRQVLNTLWRNAPDGIPGQDDLGAMSAWYAFSAMGLYPQYPGRGELLVSAPLFPKITIDRGSLGRITINAPGAAADKAYVAGLSLNGRATGKTWLPESFLSGGRLDFTLSARPSAWGSAPADAPPSFRAPSTPPVFAPSARSALPSSLSTAFPS